MSYDDFRFKAVILVLFLHSLLLFLLHVSFLCWVLDFWCGPWCDFWFINHFGCLTLIVLYFMCSVSFLHETVCLFCNLRMLPFLVIPTYVFFSWLGTPHPRLVICVVLIKLASILMLAYYLSNVYSSICNTMYIVLMLSYFLEF